MSCAGGLGRLVLRRGPVAALVLGVGLRVVVPRRELAVRLIRALDRRGGITTRRGARAYGRLAGLFSGLHRAVAVDVLARVAGRSATVVDIGAGPGGLLAALAPQLPSVTLVGIEPSAEMRDLAARRGIRELDGLAERLPLADASVDLAVSTLSAHHWDDPIAAFRELHRVLRRDGEARIYDVRFAAYGPAEARTYAVAAGFEPAQVDRNVLPARLLGLRAYCVITLRRQRARGGLE